MASIALTAVAGVNCNKRAGVKALYLIKTSEITDIVCGTTSHDITDITFGSVGVGFGKINFKRGECEVTESGERSNTATVNFAVPNPNAAQRFELEAISKQCELYAVAELYDNERLLFVGYDSIGEDESFLSYTSNESTSGKAQEDDNLFSMVLTATQSEILRVVTGLSGVSATTKTAIIAELVAATNV